MNNTPDAKASVINAQMTDPTAGLAKECTSFAKFRTQLALDRTTLAWIRTALTMATFGFGTTKYRSCPGGR